MFPGFMHDAFVLTLQPSKNACLLLLHSFVAAGVPNSHFDSASARFVTRELCLLGEAYICSLFSSMKLSGKLISKLPPDAVHGLRADSAEFHAPRLYILYSGI